MPKINLENISFKDFYVLEEGIGSSIIEKFRDLKKEIMTKDLDGNPINTKKIKSLEQEILELLKSLARLNKDVFKRFADMIIGDPLIKMNKKVAGLKIGFWLTAIMHLLVLYGASSYAKRTPERYESQGINPDTGRLIQRVK